MPVTKLNALRKAGKGFKDAPLVIRARIGIWTNYKQAAFLLRCVHSALYATVVRAHPVNREMDHARARVLPHAHGRR